MVVAASMLMLASATNAFAQNVVVMVNGSPITAIDIEQRSKFIHLTTQKTPARQAVIDELIDEKLKVKEAKRWGINVSDADVESTFNSMASRMHVTGAKLTENLAKSGVSAYTLKDRIRAEASWSQLVRGRYQASLQLSEKDIEDVLESKNIPDKDASAYDYYMRPILLLVPPGSSSALIESRRKEAESLRARFRGCVEGVALARTLPDVAVRDQVVKSTGDLTPELRKVVEGIPMGQLSAPELTRLGIEMFALCDKQPSKADTPGKRQARDAAFAKRFEHQSKVYLQRLRREALIERR
jgi:peptidyl-prolyl cis-trans isomerase SurA